MHHHTVDLDQLNVEKPLQLCYHFPYFCPWQGYCSDGEGTLWKETL